MRVKLGESRRAGCSNASSARIPSFPWWLTERSWAKWIREAEVQPKQVGDHLIVKTRSATGSGVSLLVDTGSPDNLCSDDFTAELADAARRAGRPPPTYASMIPLAVGGIGSGTQTATHKVTLPINLGNTDATFTAPELPNCSIPGLLGRRALREHRVLLDCYNNKFIMVGPGGYDLQLSPGSETFDLEESPAGHLMLPCSKYIHPSAAGAANHTEAIVFATEPSLGAPVEDDVDL